MAAGRRDHFYASRGTITHARADGLLLIARLVLDEPFEIPANAPFAVTVLALDASDRERERASWAALGARSLARACGDDEPEYTVADLRP